MKFETRVALGWVVAVVVLAWIAPDGRWTIDDGIKRIAAEQGSGMWGEFIADGPIRSQLEHPDDFALLAKPFAARADSGFVIGFSPVTRAWFRLAGADGSWPSRLWPLVAVLLLWWLMARRGILYAFLLLPMTFYGLVSWEHGLTWLLSWPAISLILMDRDTDWKLLWPAALAMAAAIAFRPEAAILGAVLGVMLLVRRQVGRFVSYATGIAGGLVVIGTLHAATSGQSSLVQVMLNSPLEGAGSVGGWLADRAATAYRLLASTDSNALLSVLLIALFAAGFALCIRSETRGRPEFYRLGLLGFAVFAALYWFRVWSYDVPPLALISSGSVLVAAPWLAVLLRPPFRGRPALVLGAVCVAAAIVLAPISSGVHWGPRLLLFALPLFAIDLVQSGHAKSQLFHALLMLTAVQTIGSAVMVYARADESADHTRLLEEKTGKIVVCTTRSQCADLAPLWEGREFFVAGSPRELSQLLIEFREAGLDTVWLHLDAYDPLYVIAFPEARPVWPYRMTVLYAGDLYTTQWRLYELVMCRDSASWGEVLDREAGFLIVEERLERALELQREATGLMPDSAAMHSNLAMILGELGRTEEAIREATIATELDPRLREPRRLLEILTGDP